ncbi:MAG: hypothetical protein MUC41_02800 [Syntrophobacteraceae bacterium]|jgi:hypothetical protein|nr:hypothetical protein [Syntrophobacteraceae bacterium]
MAQSIDLKAALTTAGGHALRVGANPQPPNELKLQITNFGEAIVSSTRKPPDFWLKGTLGQAAGALFSNKEDARDCTITKPDHWHCDWDFPGGDTFGLKIYSYGDMLLSAGGLLEIALANVVSMTSPGEALLSFETDLSGGSQKLTVVKESDTPDIIYFISDPEEGVQNCPGDTVTLKWRTHQLTNLGLYQIGVANPLRADFSTEEGSKEIHLGTAGVKFLLRGYDGSKPIERTLSLGILQPGWYGARNSLHEGDPGYPRPENEDDVRELKRRGHCDLEPTLLLNANDIKLYAVFRFTFRGMERAFLFETLNPFGPWKLVPSSVPGEAGCSIPAGFATSPGVYFDDRIWLIGGSQIDPAPERCSNGVWSLDPRQGRWEPWEAAPWPSRMGHAVLAFQGKIWVLGGRDEAGNALDDIWTLDITQKAWAPAGTVPRKKRCLLNPTVFHDRIWLYGGAEEPFSDQLYDDAWVYQFEKNEENQRVWKWEEVELTVINAGVASRKPIASCLQVFRGRLHLFGKFKTIAADKSQSVEPLVYCLVNPSTNVWEAFPCEGLKGWGGDTTFSYQVVAFRDRLLIARALSYESVNPVMKIYVPQWTR